MASEAPAYHTAYDKEGKPICPECGYDFTGQKRLNVQAHSANHWGDIPIGEAYNEARRRKGLLEKIAKELGD